jgi:hypothetical protein
MIESLLTLPWNWAGMVAHHDRSEKEFAVEFLETSIKANKSEYAK